MYEHLRNDFVMKLSRTYTRAQTIEIAAMLDSVAADYEISAKSTELAIVENTAPHVVMIYLSSKRLEGLSDATIDNYYGVLRNFFDIVQKEPEKITTNDLRMFFVTYKTRFEVSDRTLDKYRQILNVFFAWLVDEEYISKNPCKNISAFRYEATPRKSLSRIQLEMLRRLCKDPRDLAIVDMLFSTGCRVNELVNMKLSDIDIENRSIHIIGKGRKHNTVYINDNAFLSLKAYLEARKGDSDYIFLSERAPYGRISTRSVQNILKGYESQIGARLSPHIMRHTMATLSLKAGMKITEVQKVLGHANVSTTQIYAETLQEDVMNAHRRYVV